MKARCRLCSHEKGGFCLVKLLSGVPTKRSPNKPRDCSSFEQDILKFAAEADKEYEKNKIPRFVPTWRYYASNNELKEADAEKGPKFVLANPNTAVIKKPNE
jgi:hypothetical protein